MYIHGMFSFTCAIMCRKRKTSLSKYFGYAEIKYGAFV